MTDFGLNPEQTFRLEGKPVDIAQIPRELRNGATVLGFNDGDYMTLNERHVSIFEGYGKNLLYTEAIDRWAPFVVAWS